MRRLLSHVAVAGAALVAAASPASAARAVQSGWWTSAPVTLAPDVGDDRLLVQGGADPAEPLAYAALSFDLDSSEVPASLELSVAPDGGTTPGATLAVCALTGTATKAQGAPASEGPTFDCGAAVEATPSGDGTYTADVSAFAADGTLDVALVPTQPTDRIVLQRPRPNALRSSAGTDEVVASAPDGGVFDTGPSPTFDSPTTGGTFDAPAPPAPDVPVESPSRPSTDGTSQVALGASTAATGGTDGGGGSLLPFVFVTLLAVTVAFWIAAGRALGKVVPRS